MPELPPRKGVTAWEAEVGFDDDPPFVIGTLHHGLGQMTRFDLSAEDAEQFAATLIGAAAEAREAHTSMCIGSCGQALPVDPDEPDRPAFCGSESCRRYAEAEARAESYGLI